MIPAPVAAGKSTKSVVAQNREQFENALFLCTRYVVCSPTPAGRVPRFPTP